MLRHQYMDMLLMLMKKLKSCFEPFGVLLPKNFS